MTFEELVTSSDQLVARIQKGQMRESAPIPNTAIDIGIGLLPRGIVGHARKFKSRTVASRRKGTTHALHAEVDALVRTARSRVASFSVKTQNLSEEGNSSNLLRRLGAGLDSGSPLARAQRLSRALNAISMLPLIANSEIPTLITQRERSRAIASVTRRQADLERLAREVPLSSPSPGEIGLTFVGMPTVIEPLLGAVRRLTDTDSESLRQGLNSLRVALDALVAERGGPGDWQVVGRRLVPRSEDWNVLRSYHHLLSRASHAGTLYRRSDLELGIGMFLVISRNLLSRT
jgi:hypothetical protein